MVVDLGWRVRDLGQRWREVDQRWQAEVGDGASLDESTADVVRLAVSSVVAVCKTATMSPERSGSQTL